MKGKDSICVALDVDNLEAVSELVESLAPHVGSFKIASELGISIGAPQAVRFVAQRKGGSFLDLKFHDIGNQVRKSVLAATRLSGIRMLNLHCGGGTAMMKAAVKGRDEGAAKHGDRPLLIGVTVLTTLDAPALVEIGFPPGTTPEWLAINFARLAKDCGLDGVVASAQEAKKIRFMTGPDFLIVTPAIRPPWATWIPEDDQKRSTTHIEAVQAGANIVVVGRPVLNSPDPVATVLRMAEEMDEASAATA